jgi:hypothetical protein
MGRVNLGKIIRGAADKIGGRGTRQALEAVVNYTPGKPGGFSVHRPLLAVASLTQAP